MSTEIKLFSMIVIEVSKALQNITHKSCRTE